MQSTASGVLPQLGPVPSPVLTGGARRTGATKPGVEDPDSGATRRRRGLRRPSTPHSISSESTAEGPERVSAKPSGARGKAGAPEVARSQSESEEVFAEPVSDSGLIFLFDWDDTILPTSWLVNRGLLADGGAEVAQYRGAQERAAEDASLACLDTAACGLLDAACKLGRVVIVTAGTPAWVERTASCFLPRAFQRVRWIPVLPRSTATKADEHKLSAFREVVARFSPATMVSVGDSMAERRAALALRGHLPSGGLVHTVLLPSSPAVDDLTDQLVALAQCLSTLAGHQEALDLVVALGQPQTDGSRSFALNWYKPS